MMAAPRFDWLLNRPSRPGWAQVWKQQAVERGEMEAHEVVGALPFPSQAAAERYDMMPSGPFVCTYPPCPHDRPSTAQHSCRRFLLDAHAHEPGFPVRVHSLGVAGAHVVSFPAAAAGACI